MKSAIIGALERRGDIMNNELKERFDVLMSKLDCNVNKDGHFEISISDVLDLELEADELIVFMEYLKTNNCVIVDSMCENGYLSEAFIENGELSSTNIYINEIMMTPLFTADEEKKYFKLYQETGDEALKKFICERNLKLVFSIAKNRKFNNSGVSFMDLVQEGNIALIKAVEGFDYRNGVKFSTYATFSITNAMIDAIHDFSRNIRIARNMSSDIFNVKNAMVRLSSELGREPSVSEIANNLGLLTERVKECLEYDRTIISLNTPANDEEDTELGDFIPDRKRPFDERIVNHIFDELLLNEINNVLSEREAFVVNSVYGLNGYERNSRMGVGRIFGISHQAVSQIEKRALKKLRNRYTGIFNAYGLDIKSNLSR